jgi:hypothetical protein
MAGVVRWKSLASKEFALQFGIPILSWGEAALLPYLFMALILKNFKEGRAAAVTMLDNAALLVISNNGRRAENPTGLIPPHFSIDFVVRVTHDMLDEEFGDNYKGSSHYLLSIVEMLARMNEREIVSKYWREISFIHFEEFKPDTAIDYYLGRCNTGENLTIVPKKEKSWSELQSEAESHDGAKLPATMKRFPDFLPFFLMAFPHRAGPETFGYLYKTSIPKPKEPK